jgi:hypothetical protein
VANDDQRLRLTLRETRERHNEPPVDWSKSGFGGGYHRTTWIDGKTIIIHSDWRRHITRGHYESAIEITCFFPQLQCSMVVRQPLVSYSYSQGNCGLRAK